jgi:hypothetical protein
MPTYKDEKQSLIQRIIKALSPRFVLVVLVVMIIQGVYLWLFDVGFSIKRDPLVLVVAKLSVTSIMAIGCGVVCDWIVLKDNVSHPLGLRLLYLGLLLILCLAAFLATCLIWDAFPPW